MSFSTEKIKGGLNFLDFCGFWFWLRMMLDRTSELVFVEGKFPERTIKGFLRHES